MRLLFTLWFPLCGSWAASAQTPSPELEDRARVIGQSLRCVICQNQSINESEAPLAQDMRKLVRKQLEQGMSNDDIIGYMRGTYGDYVLLKPPVQSNTLILWFGPFLLLLVVLIWFVKQVRTPQSPREDTE